MKNNKIRGTINNDNYPAPDKILASANKKNWKGYLPITLIAIFLIIFLSSLVFEFYHIVNKKNPSVALTEKEQQMEQEIVEENSNSYLDKIKNFFSKQQKEDLNPEQENSKTVEKEPDSSTTTTNNLQADSKQRVASTNSNLNPNNTPDTTTTNIVNSEQFKTIHIDKNKHKYSLQLMAVKEENFENLKKVAKILIAQDYYAYIYRTPRKIKNRINKKEDYYFRLRIGFFEKKQDAVKIAHKLISQYPKTFKNYFVALPLKEEYQSDFFVFSAENQEGK